MTDNLIDHWFDVIWRWCPQDECKITEIPLHRSQTQHKQGTHEDTSMNSIIVISRWSLAELEGKPFTLSFGGAGRPPLSSDRLVWISVTSTDIHTKTETESTEQREKERNRLPYSSSVGKACASWTEDVSSPYQSRVRFQLVILHLSPFPVNSSAVLSNKGPKVNYNTWTKQTDSKGEGGLNCAALRFSGKCVRLHLKFKIFRLLWKYGYLKKDDRQVQNNQPITQATTISHKQWQCKTKRAKTKVMDFVWRCLKYA